MAIRAGFRLVAPKFGGNSSVLPCVCKQLVERKCISSVTALFRLCSAACLAMSTIAGVDAKKPTTESLIEGAFFGALVVWALVELL